VGKLRWAIAAAGVLFVCAGWWWFSWQAGRQGIAERIAGLRASGAAFTVEDRCAGHAPGDRDLMVWWQRLTDAAERAPYDDEDPGEVLVELELDPMRAWSQKDWKLDDESWTVEGAHLAHRVSQLEEVCAVARTVGDYEGVDACSLIGGLAPPQRHPLSDFTSLFLGCKALGMSTIQAARTRDLELVQRNLEACLVLIERLYEPVSVIHFDAWALCLHATLGELEAVLPLLEGRLDLEALERRLAAFAPRDFLVHSLEWERAYALGDIEWFARQTQATSFEGVTLLPLLVDVHGDLEHLIQGYDLGVRHVRLDGVTQADLEDFYGTLGRRTPLSAMLMPMFDIQSRSARTCESQLALALTGTRVLRHGRAGWDSVARELDPSTNQPLSAELLEDGRLRLRAVAEVQGPDDRPYVEWIVFR